MSDKKRIYAKLQRLPLELYLAYAVRKAIQLMPVLAMTLTRQQAQLHIRRQEFFQYWPEPERALHLLNLLRAVDAALYMADSQARSVIQPRSNLEYLKIRSLRALRDAEDAFAHSSGVVTVCVLEGIFEIRSIMIMIFSALDSGPEARSNLATCLAGSKVLLKDIDAFSNKITAKHYLKTPLWPGTMPKDLWGLWQDFQAAMLMMDVGFEFWQEWYQQKLDGILIEPSIWERQVFIPESVELQDPASINQYLSETEQAEAQFMLDSEPEFQPANDFPVVMEPVDSADETLTVEQSAIPDEHEGLSLEEKITELACWIEEVIALFLEQVEGTEAILSIDQLGVARQSLAAGLKGTPCEKIAQALDIFLPQLGRFTPIGNTFIQIEDGSTIQALLISRVEAVLQDLHFVLLQLHEKD